MILSSFIIFGLLLRRECASQLLEKLGWSSAPQTISAGNSLLEIPFEELGPEDKFLVEASKITGLKLSQLDVCQHKIVMKIKSSCGKLSDEDIAKLSVNLLNCQADVEGRKTFPCTEDMSLKSCTKAMDADTWNAYHIISNRARAVCYAARQEEFRAYAEMTINKLVSTARAHVEQMELMHDKQTKLEGATQLALDKISRSQHDVLTSYARLRMLEYGLGRKLEEDKSELEILGNIISKEAATVGIILKDFKKSLDVAGKELINQKKDESLEHEKLMNGLKSSLKLIDNIIQNLGKVNSLIDEHNTQYSSKAKGIFSDLEAVIKSLSQVSSNANALQVLAEQKMSLVTALIGGTGENFDMALFIFIHLFCLVLAMVVSSFLEFPWRLRALVVTAGIVNTYCSINNMPHFLRILDLYLSLAGAVIVDTTIVQILKLIKNKNNKKRNKIIPNTSVDYKNYNEVRERELNGFKKPLSKVDHWLAEKFSDQDIYGLKNGMMPTITPISKGNLLPQDDEISLASGRSTRTQTRNVSPTSSVARSSTSGRKIMCSMVRPNGQRCRLPAKPGQRLCRIHENNR